MPAPPASDCSSNIAKSNKLGAAVPRQVSVLMLAGTVDRGNGSRCQHLIAEQALSIRSLSLVVTLYGVDNRHSPRGIWRNIRTVRSMIGLESPDIVHAQYGSVLAAIGLLSAGTTPFVVSFCGSDLLGLAGSSLHHRTRNSFTRAIGLIAASLATAVIVKSGNLFNDLPPFLRKKAHVIPNGVDTEFFTPTTARSCRAKLGWSLDSDLVLFDAGRGLGRPTKNIELARDAFFELQRKRPETVLKVISDSSRTDVALALNAADCLLVTSLHEGSPNIVKEAMACNLPVVSVSCGDVEERLAHTSPGGVCCRDARALALGMERVLEASVRSNGREEVYRQRLTTQAVRERLVGVYTDALKSAKGARSRGRSWEPARSGAAAGRPIGGEEGRHG